MPFKLMLSVDGGEPQALRWGASFIPLLPGRHAVRCYVPYLFWHHFGDSTFEVELSAGVATTVQWRSPWRASRKASGQSSHQLKTFLYVPLEKLPVRWHGAAPVCSSPTSSQGRPIRRDGGTPGRHSDRPGRIPSPQTLGSSQECSLPSLGVIHNIVTPPGASLECQ